MQMRPMQSQPVQTQPGQTQARRVAAVVLPELACELASPSGSMAGETAVGGAAERKGAAATLLAVLITSDDRSGHEAGPSPLEDHQARVAVVNGAARARGVRPGMRVAEAMARSAQLRFGVVARRALDAALGALAEVAMAFGPWVEIGADDTLWIELTGVAHLFGGEAFLAETIHERFQAGRAGPVFVGIADGPFVARALALHGGGAPPPLWKNTSVRIAPPGEGKRALAALPVAALPLRAEGVALFARLGVTRIADLMRIDRAQLAARLEAFVEPPLTREEVLGWLDGRDPRPLEPYIPPEVIVEESSFEDGVESAAQLLFAVRGMVSRASLRLVGRRQAAHRLELVVHYDRTIFRLQAPGASGSAVGTNAEIVPEPRAELLIELIAPLCHTDDLFRAVKAKLEGLALAAPAVRVTLLVSHIQRAPELQLDLARDVSISPDALPALLAELSAELGPERVGVLALSDDHRPERRTQLVGLSGAPERTSGGRMSGERESKARARVGAAKGAAKKSLTLWDERWLGPPEPTRLLPSPIPLGPLYDDDEAQAIAAEGEHPLMARELFLGGERFVVTRVTFDRRLDGVAWWTKRAVGRDYLQVELSRLPRGAAASQAGRHPQAERQRGAWKPAREGLRATQAVEEPEIVLAWVFVDRRTSELFLQGYWE